MTIKVSAIASAVVAAMAGCSGDDETQIGGGDYEVNLRPAFVAGTVASSSVDGNSDDLLTAGLGKTGLASAVAPTTS